MTFDPYEMGRSVSLSLADWWQRVGEVCDIENAATASKSSDSSSGSNSPRNVDGVFEVDDTQTDGDLIAAVDFFMSELPRFAAPYFRHHFEAEKISQRLLQPGTGGLRLCLSMIYLTVI